MTVTTTERTFIVHGSYPLTYNEQPLRYRQIDKDAKMLAANLIFEIGQLANPRPVFTFIEPGDATRYSLCVLRAGGTIIVATQDGSGEDADARGAVVLSLFTTEVSAAQMLPIANNNEWSATVLAWFFAKVIGHVRLGV